MMFFVTFAFSGVNFSDDVPMIHGSLLLPHYRFARRISNDRKELAVKTCRYQTAINLIITAPLPCEHCAFDRDPHTLLRDSIKIDIT